MGPKGAWISSRRANSRSASSGDKTAAGCAAPALAGSPRPALAASHQATRHRIDQHRCITPRDRTHTSPTPTTGGGRSSAPTSSENRHPHHRPVTSLMSQKLEHIRRGHRNRLPPTTRKTPSARRPRSQRVRPAPRQEPRYGSISAHPGGNGPGQTPTPTHKTREATHFSNSPALSTNGRERHGSPGAEELLPQIGQRPGELPGHVHLGDAQCLADLGLAHVA